MAQDEENLDLVNDNSSNKNKASGNDVGQFVKKKAGEKLLDKIGKTKFGSAIKGGFKFLKTLLQPFIKYIVIVVIIIFCVIGIAAFIINAPGFLNGNLSAIYEKIVVTLYGENSKLTGEGISKEKRIELLQYINDMGLDVVGFGFAPGVEFDENEEGKIIDYTTDLLYGLSSDQSDSVNPKGDLLYYYLMANERAFIKNDDGVLGYLFDIEKSSWKGMINIEGQGKVDGIETSIDRENKSLNISVNNANLGEIFNEDKYVFSLDEWTGRYGIPIEFSLALHLATMSSGMVEELITNEDLQTMVTIGLEKAEYTINFKFRIKQEDGSVKEINIPVKAPGEVYDLATKIENGETITQEDLSIQGLFYAYTQLVLYDYNVITVDTVFKNDIWQTNDEEGKEVLDATSRHLEAIEAILDNRDIAVQVSKKGDEWGVSNATENPIYFYKDYAVNSGAYICQYTEDGSKPDENTGKLKVVLGEESGRYRISTEIQQDQETDEYYLYRINVIDNFSADNNVVNSNNASNYDEIIPKGDTASYMVTDGEKVQTNRIEGLGKIKEEGKESFNNIAAYTRLNNEAYGKMFKQIDWFISYAKWINGTNWSNIGLNYNISEEKIDEFYNSGNEADFTDISYYYTLYQEAIAAGSSGDFALTYDAIFGVNGLYEKLQNDYQKIIDNSKSNADSQAKIQNILKNSGYPELTYDFIITIHNDFLQTEDINNSDVKYVQPYIKSVIKHWYKDIDFVGSQAYSNSNDVIEMVYTGDTDLSSNIEVVTILTPIDSEQTVPQETGLQPYVIKGDLVLCDGEVQEDVKYGAYTTDNEDIIEDCEMELDQIMKEITDTNRDTIYYAILGHLNSTETSNLVNEIMEKIKGKADSDAMKIIEESIRTHLLMQAVSYNWGDGYRATKKIFTQGFYYTYDGTAETAKSVYFQEEIENGKVFAFTVADGRITSAGKSFIGSIENIIKKSDVFDEDGNFKESFTTKDGVKLVYNKNGIKVYFSHEQERVEGSTGLSTTEKVYVISIEDNGMKYLSPADDYPYAQVKSRASTINEVWDTVGVACKRVPLSFDSVVENVDENESESENGSADGQIMSLTALSILKNTNSTSADLIYRDLKEMLIELGYYTQAEFDYLETDVLTWFIPEYNPTTWPQNGGEGDIEFAACLYPKEEEETTEDGTTEESDNVTNEEEEEKNKTQTLEDILSVDKTQGFEPDLDVIAPGDCVIINQTDEGIEIEFDGESQPEIGILDGYTMVIKGINTDSGMIIITDENGEETQISYDDAIKNKTVIKVGSVLGKTGTEVIKVLLMNAKGGILSNVEDYMAPQVQLDINYGEQIEFAIEFISSFEGISDADPYDGDYYTVSIKNNNPGNDIDTIGAGITGWTQNVWERLGYEKYLIDNPDYGKGNEPPKTFVRTPIEKSIVDSVKKEQIREIIEDILEPELDRLGITWNENQKTAWSSLYYNGWHGKVIQIPELIAEGKQDDAKKIWIECVSAPGHYARRATEWVLFTEGIWENTNEHKEKCRQKIYGGN